MAIPDADIHPHATGLAAEIVKQHENADADIVLYSGWFCPFVQRAWIVLEEKYGTRHHQTPWSTQITPAAMPNSNLLPLLNYRKIPYRYTEINPYHKSPSFLALNPRGLVPTLQVPTASGPQPLIESTIICDYLNETHPTTPLYPSDPFTKAKLRVSIDYVTSRIIPAFHRFLQHTPTKPYSLETARKEFLGTLLTFIRDADAAGPYFAGAEFGMVDVVLAPWAVRLWVFDHFKGGVGIPEEGEGGEDEELWGRWRRWATAVGERESVKGTLSEREHYLPLWERYAEDRAMSELAKATREGRGVP